MAIDTFFQGGPVTKYLHLTNNLTEDKETKVSRKRKQNPVNGCLPHAHEDFGKNFMNIGMLPASILEIHWTF